MWLCFDGGAGQLAWCGGVCRARGWVSGILGLLRGLGVGLTGARSLACCGGLPPMPPSVPLAGRRATVGGQVGGAAEHVLCLHWGGKLDGPGYPAGAFLSFTD
ncbi:hypothetical protein CHARACLAT_015297 [Characodon lateralis]|uniref:Secreted protein n=1 Tax=Characodon lateralis TaxID=208331 RepID=A0ABU7E0N7_9TELE|nr:hypothetical protein [Characodon lateralis]